MADHEPQLDLNRQPQVHSGEDLLASSARKLLADVQSSAGPPAAGAEAQNAVVESAAFVLPALKVTADRKTALPWEVTTNGVAKEHMGFGQAKDGIVRFGEGPEQVAERLLGQDASRRDVELLTRALEEQYQAETHGRDPQMRSLRIGHSLLTEQNIEAVLKRIKDPTARQRIADCLRQGWSLERQPLPVPFGADGRPDETRPSAIPNPAQFEKALAAAAINVNAEGFRAKGECALGARLALNELPDWHIDGGSVDKSINKDPNGWRSGLKLALDLRATGLFDSIPLRQIGVQNLKAGYIVGRYHNPGVVKQHPSWGGEDMGDIDIKTDKHTPPPDGPYYHDSFVLIPKAPAKPSS